MMRFLSLSAGPLAPFLALALASPLFPQDPCEGNGLGNVYIQSTPAVIGSGFDFDLGSPDLPFGIGILAYSKGFGPVTLPGFGTVCLDILSPTFNALPFVLSGTGNAHIHAALPADPGLYGAPPFFAAPATLNGSTLEIGKTVPLFFEHSDGFSPTGKLAFGRSMHRTTALGQDAKDNRIQIFVSGGGNGTLFVPQATNKTEIFQPLDRTFHAGPNMAQQRAFHSATLLGNGKVLIAGGVNASGGVTATCELYDHTTGAMSSTGSMIHGRIAHTATRLADGRVLVTGGLANYQDADLQLAVVLDTAQNTGEVYNPATGTWTAVANTMSSVRSGHAAALESDGRVLLISGINGGVVTTVGTDVPTFTATCDRYNPATNQFVSAPAMPLGRGFQGASRLASGELLVTGGLITAGPFGEALATSTCYRFNGSLWTQTGSLPAGVAFHSQVALLDGNALISGGYLGDFVVLMATAASGVHNGATYTAGAPVGTNVGAPASPASPRGSHTMTTLWDGSFLLLGGFHSPDTSTLLVKDDGFIYTP
jgi:hypothetical protein